MLAAAAVAILVAGCGASEVDTAKIERELRAHIADEANVDPGKVQIDCPQKVDDQTGQAFTCTLAYAGTHRTIVVRLEPDAKYSATVQTKTTP